MRTRSLLVPLLALGVTAGCQTARQSPGDASKTAACRARTDQVYRARNRGAIFLPTDQRDTPFASSYDPGDTSRGLGDLFGRDQMQAECLRGLGDAAPEGASTGPVFTPHNP